MALKELMMKCPYCEKENFIPDVVSAHTESYGKGIKNFNCLHCKKVVKMNCKIRIVFSNPSKTNEDSYWPNE